MDFINFLIKKNILNESSAQQVRDLITENGGNIEAALVKIGIMPNVILQNKSEFLGIPLKILNDVNVPFEILQYIPEESARHYKFAPISITDGFLEVGMINPDDLEAKDALNFISSKTDVPFKIFLISQEGFEQVLKVYKGLSGQVNQALEELNEDDFIKEENILETKQSEDDENTRIIEDAPVTKIVATVLTYAVEGNASDVHIEPMYDKVRVRFRVDGTLKVSLLLPLKVLSAVVARIKILSKMKLDEKRKPQDGRFSTNIDNRRVDFRVSTFPSYYGEKVVMRILDQQKGIKNIDELGLSERNMALLREAITRPYGLILISGPTGSGKSTTLYSLLKEVDKEKHNVLSLEDPVEYSVEGVSQSQVRPDIGYTFATGLRTTLRQDPDIIMVGEIRDGETAKLAIQAALTGHLVLSTIHTNTASGIIPRLIDMGVDPFLIPPTLILGMAQRLVKKICPNTGEPIKIEGSIKEMLRKQFEDLPEQYRSNIPYSDEFLKIKPSPTCPTGTSGRMAVFEMYEMDKDVEKVILENPVESEVFKVVRSKGMITIKEDAIVKAMKKLVPFEEINAL